MDHNIENEKDEHDTSALAKHYGWQAEDLENHPHAELGGES